MLALRVTHELHVNPVELAELMARSQDDNFLWWAMFTFNLLPYVNYAIVVDWKVRFKNA